MVYLKSALYTYETHRYSHNFQLVLVTFEVAKFYYHLDIVYEQYNMFMYFTCKTNNSLSFVTTPHISDDKLVKNVI